MKHEESGIVIRHQRKKIERLRKMYNKVLQVYFANSLTFYTNLKAVQLFTRRFAEHDFSAGIQERCQKTEKSQENQIS